VPTTLEAVRSIELADIREARKRIAKTIVRTPLFRLELGPDYPDIRLKLENQIKVGVYRVAGRRRCARLVRWGRVE
jgi:threonine dehydratase